MAFLDFFCALCLLSFFTETYGTPSNISVSDCHIRLADVVFAMDQSGSVGETFYRIGLQIIADYVRHHIGTGAEKVRVGFTLFDEVGSVALNLKSFTTKNDTADFISHLNYSGGDTNISAGMDAAITVFEQDLNNGSDISRILILITDGADESDVTTQYLRAKKIRIIPYAIGILPMINETQLEAATGEKSNVIEKRSYQNLSEALQEICVRHEYCRIGPTDLVIVMDESGSIGIENFVIGLNAAIQLTNSLQIGEGSDKSRVGLVVFGNYGRVVFNLTQYTNNDDVSQAINQTTYGADGTDIANGMEAAITQVFIPALRDESIPRIMLIITDGADSSDVTSQQQLAAKNNIWIYGLGVTKGVNLSELMAATGDEDRVYYVDEFPKVFGAMRSICRDIEMSSWKLSLPTTVAPPRTSAPETSIWSSLPPPVPEVNSCGCEHADLYKLQYWMDVIFVLDSSSDITVKTFTNIKDLIRLFASRAAIKDASEKSIYSRIAIVNAGITAHMSLTLSTFRNTDELQQRLDQIHYLNDSTFNVADAANEVRRIVDQSEPRNDAPKVMVIATSRNILCEDLLEKRTTLEVRSDTTERRLANGSCVNRILNSANAAVVILSKRQGNKEPATTDLASGCGLIDITDDINKASFHKALCYANCFCQEDGQSKPKQLMLSEDLCSRRASCINKAHYAFSFDLSAEHCSERRSILASPLNEAETRIIQDIMNTSTYWVGMVMLNGALYLTSSNHSLTRLNKDDFESWCQGATSKDDGCVYEWCKKPNGCCLDVSDCGLLFPTHKFACQKPACSVKNYCQSLPAYKTLCTESVTDSLPDTDVSDRFS